MNKVYIVVYENEDFDNCICGVYDNKISAKKRKYDLMLREAKQWNIPIKETVNDFVIITSNVVHDYEFIHRNALKGNKGWRKEYAKYVK